MAHPPNPCHTPRLTRCLAHWPTQPNGTTVVTDTEKKDWRNAQRGLMTWSMLCKVYVVQFLKNNQEWAGPAGELKKQSVQIGPQPFGINKKASY